VVTVERLEFYSDKNKNRGSPVAAAVGVKIKW